jgi:DNA-binding PadR family transcriptional regulator
MEKEKTLTISESGKLKLNDLLNQRQNINDKINTFLDGILEGKGTKDYKDFEITKELNIKVKY